MLKTWMFSFLEGSKYLTLNDRFFDKEKTYFGAVNNQEKYFRGYENICCILLLKNILMTSSHIVFTMPLDLINDQCYHLHAKTTSFCFTFVLVIVNPIILVLVLKIYLMRGTCYKRSSETTWHIPSHELLQDLVAFSILLNMREM